MGSLLFFVYASSPKSPNEKPTPVEATHFQQEKKLFTVV